MSAADVFERVAKRCPFDPGSGKWSQWISTEMRKVEDLDNKILAIRRGQEDERKRHQSVMRILQKGLKELQQYCDHEMRRGTAECESVCQRCEWTEDGRAGCDG